MGELQRARDNNLVNNSVEKKTNFLEEDSSREVEAPPRSQVSPHGRTCAALRRFCGHIWGEFTLDRV
jgi:hypothetical protein